VTELGVNDTYGEIIRMW